MPGTAPQPMGCSIISATTSNMPPTKGTSGEPSGSHRGLYLKASGCVSTQLILSPLAAAAQQDGCSQHLSWGASEGPDIGGRCPTGPTISLLALCGTSKGRFSNYFSFPIFRIKCRAQTALQIYLKPHVSSQLLSGAKLLETP